MRIMILGLRGIPAVEGGIERHVESLSPLLTEMGCDVEVVSRRRYRGRMGNGDWRGVHRTWIWSPKHPALETIVHTFLGVVYAIFKRPDVLHLHGIGPALLTPFARAFGLRVIVTHHGFDYDREKWGPFPRFMLKLGERAGVRFSNHMIVVSAVIQKSIQERFGVSTTVVPNGVCIPKSAGSHASLFRFGLTPRRYILQVSRFVPEKRQLDLLRAFAAARLEGWKLVLVGRGEGLDRYSSEVRHLAAGNPMVVLTGFQTGASLHELYGNAAGFVLPSSHEGLPIALLEALSYGLPTLASDIPANLEVAAPSGRYFPLGDLEQLTEGLRDLYRQNWTRESADNQRAWVVEHFDWRQIANQTADVYRDLVPIPARLTTDSVGSANLH
jgi:glycosyltransferase involved in cell wall biosynthesis